MNTFFEIRHCQNPACGLRYPLLENNSFGERCPICLGKTKVMIKQNLNESDRRIKHGLPENHLRFALLDNIRSAGNVGALFRASDGYGLEKLFLCGITPTPEIRAVQKTSMRTEKHVAWEYRPNALDTAVELRSSGLSLVALEQDSRAKEISQISGVSLQRAVLIVGNEVTGIDPGLLDICDHIISIPMYGSVNSFNVVSAFSIALHALLRSESK